MATQKTVRTIKTFDQDMLNSYSGFLHVITGSAQIGADAAFLLEDDVEWLDCPARNGLTMLPMVAGKDGTPFVFYAGHPQEVPIVSHGPSIGDFRGTSSDSATSIEPDASLP